MLITSSSESLKEQRLECDFSKVMWHDSEAPSICGLGLRRLTTYMQSRARCPLSPSQPLLVSSQVSVVVRDARMAHPSSRKSCTLLPDLACGTSPAFASVCLCGRSCQSPALFETLRPFFRAACLIFSEGPLSWCSHVGITHRRLSVLQCCNPYARPV